MVDEEGPKKKERPEKDERVTEVVADVGRSFVRGAEKLVTGTVKGATETAEKLAEGVEEATHDLLEEGPLLGAGPAAVHIAKGAVSGVIEGSVETAKGAVEAADTVSKGVAKGSKSVLDKIRRTAKK